MVLRSLSSFSFRRDLIKMASCICNCHRIILECWPGITWSSDLCYPRLAHAPIGPCLAFLHHCTFYLVCELHCILSHLAQVFVINEGLALLLKNILPFFLVLRAIFKCNTHKNRFKNSEKKNSMVIE
jgi:hypothetical protein